MNARGVSIGLCGLSLLLGTAARAEIPLAKSDNAEFDAGGMIQVLGFAQHLDDPYKDDARLYLFMNRARAQCAAAGTRRLPLKLGSCNSCAGRRRSRKTFASPRRRTERISLASRLLYRRS